MATAGSALLSTLQRGDWAAGRASSGSGTASEARPKPPPSEAFYTQAKEYGHVDDAALEGLVRDVVRLFTQGYTRALGGGSVVNVPSFGGAELPTPASSDAYLWL